MVRIEVVEQRHGTCPWAFALRPARSNGSSRSIRTPFPQHERLLHATARSAELHKAAVMHHTIDQGNCQLVITEHSAPLPELDVDWLKITLRFS